MDCSSPLPEGIAGQQPAAPARLPVWAFLVALLSLVGGAQATDAPPPLVDGRSGASASVGAGRLVPLEALEIGQLHWWQGQYLAADGTPATIVVPAPVDRRRRRWLPVRWLWRHLAVPAGGPLTTGAADLATAFGSPLPGDGEPYADLLAQPPRLATLGAATLLIDWALAPQVGQNLAAESLRLLLSAYVEAVRHHNPHLRIVLATPLPLPHLRRSSAALAESIRKVAATYRLPLLDLERLAVAADPSGVAFFAGDGDPALLGVGLNPTGRAWLDATLRGAAAGHHLDLPPSTSDHHPFVPGWRWPTVFDPSTSLPPEAWRTVSAVFPGAVEIDLPVDLADLGRQTLALAVNLPARPPAELLAILWAKDKDGNWFQAERRLAVGQAGWRRLEFDLSTVDGEMRPSGHAGGWDAQVARRVSQVGLRLLSQAAWRGELAIARPLAKPGPPGRRSAPPPTPGGPVLLAFEPPGQPQAYQLAEFRFQLANADGNPFDPGAVRVDGIFTAPSGRQYERPAFFARDYRRRLGDDSVERLDAAGPGQWWLRYTPLEPGTHRWTIRVVAAAGTTATGEHHLVVAAGPAAGFPRVAAADPRQFETADGRFFYPLGLNIHAPFDQRAADMLRVPVLPNRGTYAYDDYFAKMAASGQNAVVVWMCNWWVGIEWTAAWPGFNGLNDYHLGNAWRLDYLLDAAHRHGLHVSLVLDNHGKISAFVDPEWQDNPNHRANGGSCARPEDFFASPEAFEYYTRRLRYIVGRWSAHPALLGFVLVSELNLAGSNRQFKNHPSQARWVAAVGRHLAAIDAYRRPVAIQYSNDWIQVDERVASLPELDFLVGDIYKPGGSIVPRVVDTARHNGRFGKPTFSAEFGGNWNGTTPQRLRGDLHAGLWANAMTAAAGAPFFWWFDFVDRYDLYGEYAAIANFMRDEDRRGFVATTVEPAIVAGGQLSTKVKAVALVGPRAARLWVYDLFASEIWPGLEYAAHHQQLEVQLAGLPPGRYRVGFWDTRGAAGETAAEQIVVAGEPLVIHLPPFQIDLAIKIDPVD